jgi:hypothetical protein
MKKGPIKGNPELQGLNMRVQIGESKIGDLLGLKPKPQPLAGNRALAAAQGSRGPDLHLRAPQLRVIRVPGTLGLRLRGPLLDFQSRLRPRCVPVLLTSCIPTFAVLAKLRGHRQESPPSVRETGGFGHWPSVCASDLDCRSDLLPLKRRHCCVDEMPLAALRGCSTYISMHCWQFALKGAAGLH